MQRRPTQRAGNRPAPTFAWSRSPGKKSRADRLPRMDLAGRVAIITGGGHGLGRDLALGFAEAGADLSLCGTNEEALALTVKELKSRGRRVVSRVTDVSDESQVERWVAETLQELGRIDILIN